VAAVAAAMESPHGSPKRTVNAGNESPSVTPNFPMLETHVHEPLETGTTITITNSATTTSSTMGNIPPIASTSTSTRTNATQHDQQRLNLIGMSLTALTPPLGADSDEKEEKKND